MKNFYKVMAGLCAGLLVLGVLFSVLAVYTGASRYVTADGTIEVTDHIRLPAYWLQDRWEQEHEVQVPETPQSNSAGVVVIEPEHNGDTAVSQPNSAADEVSSVPAFQKGTYEIRSIEAELGAGEFILRHGDGFAVTSERGDVGKINSYVENGVWKLEGPDHLVNFAKTLGRVTITVPKDFYAESLEIELGAGKMTIKELTAKYASVSVGAGQIEMKDCYLESADLECAMGELLFDGTLTGKGSIDCGMGNVEVYTKGNPQDYGYSVDCGMGNVEIAGHKYSGLGAEAVQNTGATNYYEIDCGMGNVEFRIG